MENLFLNVLTASFHGSIVIGAVLILRLLLKKTPKKFICMLWLLAGLRLLMPFEIQSDLSLQPDVTELAEIRMETEQTPQNTMMPAVPDGVDLPADTQITIPNAVGEEPAAEPDEVRYAEPVTEEHHVVINWLAIAGWVWLAVALGFRGVELCTILVVFGAPVAVNSYTMALQMDGDADLAGGIVLLTTAVSCLTLFFWIWLLKSLGLL